MENAFWLVLALAVTAAGVAWQAHRMGNERRDVALLCVVAGVLGVSSGLVAVF